MFRRWLLCYFILARLKNVLLAPTNAGQNHEVCNTVFCKELAKGILESRNLSVDPCEHFYKYACGSWGKLNPGPSYERQWSIQDTYQEKIYAHLRDLLTEKIESTDIPPVKAVKQIYTSCLDTAELDKIGTKPIRTLLNKTGGWPLLYPAEAWPIVPITWQEIEEIYVEYLGYSVFYKFGMEFEPTYFTKIFTIERHTTLPWIDSTKVSDILTLNMSEPNGTGIYQVILTIAKEEGIVLNRDQLKKDVQDMIALEQSLLDIYKHHPFPVANKMTLQELNDYVHNSGVKQNKSKIDFIKTITRMLKKANITVKPDERVMVYERDFYVELAHYFEKIPERVIVNYIQWNLVYNLMIYTSTDMWKTKYNMINSKHNKTGYPPRWKTCLTDLELKHALSYMFVKRYLPNDVLKRVKEMAQIIQDNIGYILANSTVLTESMKLEALDKVRSVQKEIGYPEWYSNDTSVIEYYKGLKLENKYFDDAIFYKIYEFSNELQQLRTNSTVRKWFIQPTQVNAYYSALGNKIILPASQMQEPLLTPSMPDAVNYAAVGFVLGHELSHSIDNRNIYIDKNSMPILWNYTDYNPYQVKEHCFEEHYNELQFDDLDPYGYPVQIGGYLTLTENLAENIGLQAVYQVLQNEKSKRKQEIKLPGMESFSEEKLFFLSYAHNWCTEKFREYQSGSRISLDEHSPALFRVNGVLSNMPEFAATYNCTAGSKMNPVNKCNLFN